ncbi:MAG: hypothetical protein AW10_03565 [Candidatus Accumulibacter appositus]|uniref:DUF721 domain-containing protein n=1 Tax=Candidatus Accumulibacter appositus TaxID=1454003 RepID=A0A011PKY3_9PROT|nr:DciA family protein [Accumulibacter sp.]EXI77707.1 MAG: hypothetical protein AW10_03565 [Candidatus Accumulibacter appositus]HRF03150.1 DciA family protein [Accumulibacter sp.]
MTDSLHSYLEGPEGAGKVMAHARLLTRLASLFQEIVPAHLGQASSLANFKSGIVLIYASNGGVATKLRQMAPTLVDEFLRRGIECSGLQVKVQARTRPAAIRTAAQKPLSSRTSERLTALSDSLPPASPLRSALEHLLAHTAREE